MHFISRLKTHLASAQTAFDGGAILFAFSLIPFFAALKLWLLLWYKTDQGANTIMEFGVPHFILFLGSDALLCLGLAGLYFMMRFLWKILPGRKFPETTAIFAIHCAVVLFAVISLKVNQLYGSPMTIFHLRMADDLSVMRGSIASYIDIESVGMMALGVFCFWAASVLDKRFAAWWTTPRWCVWSVLTIACIGLAGASYAQFRGVYTYGLKKNALINFIIYYQPLPETRDFRAIANHLNAVTPRNVDWFAPLQSGPSQPYRDLDYSGIARGKNLILIVLESTVKEYIDEETTPRLHKMLENSIVFPDYFTTAVNSFQANYSIFYSDYVGDVSRVGHPKKIYNGTLPVASLAEVLHGHGYRTSLFFSGLLSYTDIGYLWRDKGLDVVDGAESILRKTGGGGWVWGAQESQTVEVMSNWIDKSLDRPFFISYVTGYPHHPYHVPVQNSPFPNDSWRNRYRNSLNYVDQNVGKLLDHLERKGLLTQTVVAVVGDHGETLDTDIAGHGIRMDLNEMQVPFYIYNPSSFPARVDRPVPANHLDLAPSLTGVLGIQQAADWSGRNLLLPHLPPRKLFVQLNGNNDQSAIVDGDIVYLRDEKAGSDELFRRDAGALKPLPETPETTELARQYGLEIREFENWVLLRHLERACKDSDDPASICGASKNLNPPRSEITAGIDDLVISSMTDDETTCASSIPCVER